MTPLAHQLTKILLTSPSKVEDGFWRLNRERLRSSLEDIHCFEVTAVLPAIGEMAETMTKRFGRCTSLDEWNANPLAQEASGVMGRLVFLPAPKTWIEWLHPWGFRMAVLLEEKQEWDQKAAVSWFFDHGADQLGWISTDSDDFYCNGGQIVSPPAFAHLGGADGALSAAHGILGFSHQALMMINSPRIIGRRQHMPHRGLERDLLRASKQIGKFPLHAWTEIRLEVNKPPDIDDGELHEAHLTGRRALHFCRKHLRFRNGRLEYVRAHWRGDPILGIKQSRYVVTP